MGRPLSQCWCRNAQWEESCGTEIDCCSQVRDDRGLRFKLTEFNIYPTFSYRGSQTIEFLFGE